MHENITITKALAFMRRSPAMEDYEIYSALLREGVDSRSAARLVEFLPLVYGRWLLANFGLQFSQTFRRYLPDGRFSESRTFSSEPVWNAIVTFARAEVESGLSREDLLAVASRSAEVGSVSKLLKAKDDPKGATTETYFLWPEDGPDGRREMTELELEDAKRVLDWQHWAPPMALALVGLALLAAFWHEELSAKVFLVISFGVPSALLWLLFLRNKQRVQRDVDARMIEIVDGSPDKVWRSLGMCFVSFAGKKIRVPAEYYGQLQAATSVTVKYLPESLIALHIKPHRGLHLQ